MTGFSKVRVRVAPSPTGDPHVGLAYISLFNYVFAKKHGGDFILRIEDTDQTRAKASSDELIIESLKWLGMTWDEGPDCGGSFGPYRQSLRTDIYAKHANELIEQGNAYYCFCSSERLDSVRTQQKKLGQISRYDRHCRERALSETLARKKNGESCVVRLKMPLEGKIRFVDELRGPIEIDAHQLDDQVLLKSDGFPTYHLANVVDDYLMKISHVIRAEEWISSTPKHVVLYDAFGWQKPQFIHMPLLRNIDRSKISKRKNPVSINYYKRKGILPQAMLNFLGLMGWSFGEDREVFSLKEMIDRFDFKDVSLGGPVFDVVKLTSINQTYMQKLSPRDFASYLRNTVFSEEYLMQLYPHVISRLECFEQFVDKNSFFFNGRLGYEQFSLPKGHDSSSVRKMLKELVERLDELYEWQAENIQKLMEEHRNQLGWKPKDYFMTVRLVTTGRKDSPPLAESMELVGREMVRFRMRDILQTSIFA